MAQANVEVKVQSQDLERLKGQLVELQKGLKIQYDIDGKPIDVVIDKSLNLQKQVRLLTAELRKTKEGTAEFQILSSRLGQAQDDLAKTTAKSRDLLSSLQLLPGPVGSFFSQLNGAIGLLKTFSSFSLKDLRFQFKETIDDVKDIFTNLTGAKNAVDELGGEAGDTKNTLNDLTTSIQNNAGAAAANSSAIANSTAAIQKSNLELVNFDRATGQAVSAQQNVLKATTQTGQSFKFLQSEQQNATNAIKGSNQALQVNAVANEAAAGATTTNAGATTTYTAAARGATVATISWGAAIRGLLIATGIGALVVLIGAIIEKLYILGQAFFSTEEEAAALNRTLERQKQLYDDLAAGIDAQTQINIERAKQNGATEEQIFEIRKKGLQDQLTATRQSANDIAKIENDARAKSGIYAKLSEEERIKIINDANKQKQDLFNKEIDITRQIELEGEKEKTRIAEKGRNDRKKNNEQRLQDNKEYLDKLIQDTKTGLDKLRDLEEQNALAIIDDERKRTALELQFQKKREEDEINALKLKDTKINGVVVTGEELRQKLLEQIRMKYGIITINNTKKYNEEDQKRLIEYQRKIQDIEIAAIADKRKREDAEREIELRRVLEDLEEDKEFVKKSEEEKERIRQLIRQKYSNENIQILKDRNKEDRDERIKKLDDELRLLELQQIAIREGTRAFYDNQRAILAAAEQKEIEAAEGKEKEITAIKEKYAKLRADIDKQEKNATLQAIGESIQAFANLTGAIASSYDEEAKTSRDAFEKRKRLQIATATMSAASGIIQILTQPSTLPSPFDYIVKGVNAAALAVTTAVQIANIKKTQFEGASSTSQGVRGYARGGMIDGPRHAQGGTIIEAEGGEAVMTRGAVSMFRPILSMMNEAGGGTSFNKNLMVTANDAPLTTKPAEQMAPTILKTYVVSNELTTEQEKLARLKNLSTL